MVVVAFKLDSCATEAKLSVTNFGLSTKTIRLIKYNGKVTEVINPANKNQRLLVKNVSLRNKKWYDKKNAAIKPLDFIY